MAKINVDLKSLVTVPISKYAKILDKDGTLVQYSQKLYHIDALKSSVEFLNCFKNPERKTINIVNTTRMKQINENRARLKPIIQSVLFCGRQNISLRGHRDQGSLLDVQNKTNSSAINEGNFRELLRFRVSAGDTVLENHLKSTSARATYISHTTRRNYEML